MLHYNHRTNKGVTTMITAIDRLMIAYQYPEYYDFMFAMIVGKPQSGTPYVIVVEEYELLTNIKNEKVEDNDNDILQGILDKAF